jgi:hypothetical protein
LESCKSPQDLVRGEDYNEVQRCVDNGIADVFGKGLLDIIYWELETEAKFRKEDITSKPREFVAGLVKILGKEHSKALEEAIRNRIVKHFDLEPEKCSNVGNAIILALKNGE